jgi:hypothetical protein
MTTASPTFDYRTKIGAKPAYVSSQLPLGLLSSAIFRCVACVAAFLATGYLFGTDSRLASLVGLWFGGLIGIALLCFQNNRLSGTGFAFWAYLAFTIRMALGIWHNLTFLDPKYFSEPTQLQYIWDFKWMDYSMKTLTEHWLEMGFSPFFPDRFLEENKNAYLFPYLSQLYYWTSSDFHLNITAWNSLHTVLTGFIFHLLAQLWRLSSELSKLILLAVLFEPFGIFTNVFFRDTTGLFFVAMSALLVTFTGSNPTRFTFLTPLAAASAYLLRPPYLLISLAASVLDFMLNRSGNRAANFSFIAVIVLPFAFLLGLTDLVADTGLSRHAGQFNPDNILRLPFRIVRALTGPFPWTQYFKEVPGWEFQPFEYIQAVFNLTVLWIAAPELYKMLRTRKPQTFVPIYGLFYFISGAIAPAVHLGYVSVGIPFLIFAFPDKPGIGGVFTRRLFVVFAIFILLNWLYTILGLTGSGLLRRAIYR